MVMSYAYFNRWIRPKGLSITPEATAWFRGYMNSHPNVLAFENKAWGRPVLAHIDEYLNYEFVQPNHKKTLTKIIRRGSRVIPEDIREWTVATAEEMKHPEEYLKGR